MLKRSLLGVLGLGLPMAACAQVVNFHNAYNYANGGSTPPLYGSVVYSGQGAYSDPGNNFWNGFGGGFVPTSGGFSPGDNNHTTPPGVTSTGAASPISITLNYDGDNGGLGGTGSALQGTPGYLLSQASIVNQGSPGVFTLNNVPAGTYNLYLYGANNDNTRGAAFAMTIGGGTPVSGITTTINPNNGANNVVPSTVQFVLGQNYVEYLGVSPNTGGTISGTWSAVSNPLSGLSGEGDFNGLQLVNVTPVPEPASLAFGIGASAFLLKRRRRT